MGKYHDLRVNQGLKFLPKSSYITSERYIVVSGIHFHGPADWTTVVYDIQCNVRSSQSYYFGVFRGISTNDANNTFRMPLFCTGRSI